MNAIFLALNQTNPYTKIRFVNDTDIYNQVMATPNYQDVSLDGVSAFIGVVGDTCYVATMDDKITYAPVDSSYMFRNITWATVIDVRVLDTSDVTNMSYMFSYCTAVTHLDLSSFDTAKVRDTSYMFYNCTRLTTIYVSGLWQMDIVNSDLRMFEGCNALIGQSGRTYNAYSVSHLDANYETGYMTFYTGKPNALVAGPNFNALLPADATEVYIGDYHNMIPADGYIDMSVSQDESVVGFSDGTKFYVTSRNGGTINTTGSMYQMFYKKTAINTIVFDNIDTSAVFNMSRLFLNCSSLATLDITKLSTVRATNMSDMFNGCAALTSIDVSHFDTSNVTSMSNMFYGCTQAAKINVGGFDTSKVTNMKNMFNHCVSVKHLDLSSFDTAKTPFIDGMFNNCTRLTTIYVSDLWQNVTVDNSSTGVFNSCQAVVGQSGRQYSGYSVSHLDANYQTGYLTFYNGKENALVAGPNFNALLPADATEIYVGDYHNNIPESDVIDLSVSGDGSVVGWLEGSQFYVTSRDGRTINTTGSMYKMFYNRTAINTIVFDNIDTSSVLNMRYLFYGCSSLTTLDIANLNTQNVTNMADMFRGCKSLLSIDVSHFDTSNVTDMSYMFADCNQAAQINVSGFDTSNVTVMNNMFYYCVAVTQLDLSSFNTAKVTNTKEMFYNCTRLTTIYVSDLWKMNMSSDYSSNMFNNCKDIVGQSGRKYNAYSLTHLDANYETGYLTYKEYIPA